MSHFFKYDWCWDGFSEIYVEGSEFSLRCRIHDGLYNLGYREDGFIVRCIEGVTVHEGVASLRASGVGI